MYPNPTPCDKRPVAIAHQRPQLTLTRKREAILLTGCLALLALAAIDPVLQQSATYHGFADQRFLFGARNAMDVLSNLPFAAFGLAGIWTLGRMSETAVSKAQRQLALLFFTGLIATAACSMWYHLAPDDTRLAFDRYGMVLPFAGLLGLAASDRISHRAGRGLAMGVLVFGSWSITIWSVSANLLPWAALQFGGMVLLLCLARTRAGENALCVPWGAIFWIYAAAKVLELTDGQVYQLTNEMISGHTLKHIVASGAALPIIWVMRRRGRPLESAAHSVATIGGR